jgi:hypothetical protein
MNYKASVLTGISLISILFTYNNASAMECSDGQITQGCKNESVPRSESPLSTDYYTVCSCPSRIDNGPPTTIQPLPLTNNALISCAAGSDLQVQVFPTTAYLEGYAIVFKDGSILTTNTVQITEDANSKQYRNNDGMWFNIYLSGNLETVDVDYNTYPVEFSLYSNRAVCILPQSGL